jgi:hypothetical protein
MYRSSLVGAEEQSLRSDRTVDTACNFSFSNDHATPDRRRSGGYDSDVESEQLRPGSWGYEQS